MRINNIWELNVLLCKHDDDVHVQVKTNDLIDRGF